MYKAKGWQLALLVVVIALLGMSAAFVYSESTNGSSNSAVKACFNPGNSNLRAAKSSNDCVRGESLVDWKQIQAQGSIALPVSQVSSVQVSHFGPIGP
ncbi:MAG TPA: hypothetical protein VII83_00475 [Gaiellaceae bacterium]|jgi:hypothetical protein